MFWGLNGPLFTFHFRVSDAPPPFGQNPKRNRFFVGWLPLVTHGLRERTVLLKCGKKACQRHQSFLPTGAPVLVNPRLQRGCRAGLCQAPESPSSGPGLDQSTVFHCSLCPDSIIPPTYCLQWDEDEGGVSPPRAAPGPVGQEPARSQEPARGGQAVSWFQGVQEAGAVPRLHQAKGGVREACPGLSGAWVSAGETEGRGVWQGE